jgi:hypothetical protein
MFAFVLSMALPITAETPAPSLTVILTAERVKAAKLEPLAPVLAVSPRGAVVVAEPNNLFMVNSRKFLFDSPSPVNDCAFTPDGALLAISGRRLGYCAGGWFHPQIDLPENGMRLALGHGRIYVYGGDNDQATSLYIVDPNRGHAKLCALPSPVGAASAVGDTLYFSAVNDLYQLAAGGEINLICHLPGPAITSVAAVDEETLYFLAGRTLYRWQLGQVGIVSEGIGDMAGWRDGALYILNTEKQSLLKLENLPGLEHLPLETP